MTRPKALFLTKYTSLGASSRYRAYQYLEFVQQAGFECVVEPLFPDRYLEQTYMGGSRRRRLLFLVPQISTCLARRWWLLVQEAAKYNVVYLEYEALPYTPLFFEQVLFRSNPRVVVDYDDPINLNYEQHSNRLLRSMLRSKIPGIVANSCQVVAGNRLLAEWTAQFNPNVTIIPTSVDLRKYAADVPRRPASDKPVIGWIGTPITARYLRLLERPLRSLRTRHDFVLKVIGAPNFTMEGIEVQAVPWREATEVDDLRTCDIGIMPIPDDPWARGKSALKLIQYLAAGVAAVASPVGANCDVLQESQNGLFAVTDEDWTEQLAVLIEQPDYRECLARAGRHTVEERFSLQGNATRFTEILRRVAAT